MDFKLEVLVIPVCDVDRSKTLCKELVWRDDVDLTPSPDFRVGHPTPTGALASVAFGTGITSPEPGFAQRMMRVVDDIVAAGAELRERAAPVSGVFPDSGAIFHHTGRAAREAEAAA